MIYKDIKADVGLILVLLCHSEIVVAEYVELSAWKVNDLMYSAITMCAQPVGQMVYGFLFDGCREAVYLVLIPTGVFVGMIGVGARRFFGRLKKEMQAPGDLDK